MIMSKYPQTTDNNFYDKVNSIYKKFRVKKEKRTLNEICNSKEFKLQLPQQFLSEFINPKTPYTGVLVYHRIGSGKTCTAVRIAEKWKKYKKIIVVVPASLKGNFRSELRSMCADDNYLHENERKLLAKLSPADKEYKEIIAKSDKRIDEYYNILSYNKFVDYVNSDELKLKNSLLIVDEIQNMISEDGPFYQALYNVIKNSPKDLRIVLLSATPMFDKPSEIALTMNLLRLKKELPVGRHFNKMFIDTKEKPDETYVHTVKNMDLFKQYIRGYVSFFRGAPPFVFPKMITKYVKCEMTSFQYESYKKVLRHDERELGTKKKGLKKVLKSLNVADLPNNFYIGTRFISNIVFPNKRINDEGFNSLTKKKILRDLPDFSCKFAEIIKRIQKCRGKVFVYSGFKEFGGIKSFVKVLEAYGYKDYAKHGEGSKRFALWSGDETVAMKD